MPPNEVEERLRATIPPVYGKGNGTNVIFVVDACDVEATSTRGDVVAVARRAGIGNGDAADKKSGAPEGA
jgi:hypothetical protein